MTRQRIAAAVAALAAVGMCRLAWFHFVAEPSQPLPGSIDPRYAALRPLLPREGAVGYLSDQPASTSPGFTYTLYGTQMYEQAQYALAPLRLRYDDPTAKVIVANLADPAGLAQLARSHGLEVVAEPVPGLAVLRPR